MGIHASLSASQTKNWLNCPGTIALKEMFPYDDPSGEAAQLGTCAHALIERCLEEGVEPDNYKRRLIQIKQPNTSKEKTVILGKSAKWPKSPESVCFEVDDDMIDATTSFIKYVLRRLVELFPSVYKTEGIEWINTDTAPYAISVDAIKRGQLKLEGWVNPLPGRDDTGGTADVTIDCWPDLLEVIDYKHGTGVLVEVEDNLQLLSYTLGRAVEDGRGIKEYTEYRYTIGQPRHHRSPPGGMSSETKTPSELATFRRRLLAGCKRVDAARECLDKAALDNKSLSIEEARETLHNMDFLSVGEDGSHCTWCPHLSECPAALNKVQETAGVDFGEDPEEIEPPTNANHLAVVLVWRPFIDKFIKAVAARAEELAYEEKMPGYKIVQKKGNRIWKPELVPEEVRTKLVDYYGVDPTEIMNPPIEPTMRTGPQIEKAVPSKMRAEFSAEFLHKPDGGLIMVPEDDDREAISMSQARDDFGDIEE